MQSLNMSWCVYLLATVEPPTKTYVGATIDVDRRLRQHNGELSGGAKATSTIPGGWYRVCYVKGFADNHEALRFEWWWKRRSAALFNKKSGPLVRRQAALEAMMSEAGVDSGLEVVYE
jgi:structure-specific endonuclease subunit SLX1